MAGHEQGDLTQMPPREGRDTRGVILAATCRVLARGGERAATVRAIANEAGLAAAVINNHFGSKNALIEEAFAHIARIDTIRLGEVRQMVADWVDDGRSLRSFLWSELCPTDEWHKIAAILWLQFQLKAYRAPAGSYPEFDQWSAKRLATLRSALGFLGDAANLAVYSTLGFLACEARFLPLSNDPLRPLLIAERCDQFVHALCPGDGLEPSTPSLFDKILEARAPKMFQTMKEAKTDDHTPIIAQMLDAAARIIADEGAAALTHRRLAEVADVSLSSTTYHFASLADVFHETIQRKLSAVLLETEADMDVPVEQLITLDQFIAGHVNARFHAPHNVARQIFELDCVAFEVSQIAAYRSLSESIAFSHGARLLPQLLRLDIPGLVLTPIQAGVCGSVLNGMVPILQNVQADDHLIRALFDWTYRAMLGQTQPAQAA